jgi:hypothetical protein
MVDRSRLVKLLNMTESQHDAEALSAIRRSNDLLRRSNTSWAELLMLPAQPEMKFQKKPESAPQPAPAARPAGWGSDLWGDEPALPPTTKKRRG